MNTKINKMTYLFPRSIILVFRQSFDLAMLVTNTCLVAEWNLMPTIRGYVTQNKTKGYWTSRKSRLKNSLRYMAPLNYDRN